MQSEDVAAVAIKTGATVVGATVMTLGIAGIAAAGAAAVLGAVASLHFEPPAEGSKVCQVALRVFALSVLAVCLGIALPMIPGCSAAEGVPVPARCGLLAIFANPISGWIRAFMSRKAGG